jgi:hypothetical protein
VSKSNFQLANPTLHQSSGPPRDRCGCCCGGKMRNRSRSSHSIPIARYRLRRTENVVGFTKCFEIGG